LAGHPALREEGGAAYVKLPEAYLDLLVIRRSAGVVALWSICTHGACNVEWVSSECAAVCPCHGSRFDVEGAVLEGPADVPLSTYPAVIDGDMLWVRRSG